MQVEESIYILSPGKLLPEQLSDRVNAFINQQTRTNHQHPQSVVTALILVAYK